MIIIEGDFVCFEFQYSDVLLRVNLLVFILKLNVNKQFYSHIVKPSLRFLRKFHTIPRFYQAATKKIHSDNCKRNKILFMPIFKIFELGSSHV